jgi:hypothetical protein
VVHDVGIFGEGPPEIGAGAEVAACAGEDDAAGVVVGFAAASERDSVEREERGRFVSALRASGRFSVMT